jgi:hypothetical protein
MTSDDTKRSQKQLERIMQNLDGDKPMETDLSGTCTECRRDGFDVIPTVVSGESDPRLVCEWCYVNLSKKGNINHERERELIVEPIFDADSTFDPHELTEEEE